MENGERKKVVQFEDLDVWKEAMDLSVVIYQNLKDCKDFGFRDQIQRASVSVPSNISEGFERKSNKEFIQFLYIAKGSAAELRTQLYLAKRIGIIDNVTCMELINKAKKIASMLYNLIKARSERFN